MKEVIINKTINTIKKYYNYDETKLLEIRYGLESLYLSIIKIVVIVLISIITHTIKELCLLFLFYGILRLTGFGLHAKKSIHCWIYSIAIFNGFPLLIKCLNIENNYLLISTIILLPFLSIYAPADTEKRPLINKKKRIVYKVVTIIISIIYISIIFIKKDIYLSKILFFSIFLETLLVLPISYKLLGLKYNNYKRYKKGGTK